MGGWEDSGPGRGLVSTEALVGRDTSVLEQSRDP